MANRKVDLKCVLLGSANVGKSCLVERFLYDRWTGEQVTTVAAHFGAKSVTLEGGKQSLTLGVWDTAGSERFEAMARHYYKGANGAVVCYDLTNLKSWEKVQHWVREVTGEEDDCIIAIVGTKLDLIAPTGSAGFSSSAAPSSSRCIPKEAAEKYATTIGARYYEVSAKSGVNATTPFVEIVRDFAKRPRKPMQVENPAVDLPKSEERPKCSQCQSS